MTEETKSSRRKKRIIAALVGTALALACQALPADYQKPCQAILSVCTGGSL